MADKPLTHIETPDEAAEQAAKDTEQVAGEQTARQAAAQKPASQDSVDSPNAAQAQQNAQGNWIMRADTWLSQAFPTNKNAVLGGIAGLIVACLFFAIGFLKTVFVIVLVLIGIALGQYADGNPKLVRTVQKLIKKH